MAEVPAPMSSPSRKRPLEDGETQGLPETADKASLNSTSSLSTPLTVLSLTGSPSKTTDPQTRAVSPSLSSLTSVSGSQNAALQTTNAVPGAVPQKRRKLTSAEKEAQRQEKEAKAKERAEAKAKRDEEKRVEEEEKQRKRAEREEKKKQKEFETQQKQQEKERAKQKEEEEKQKKERSQLRLNAFFMPKTSPAPKSPPKSTTDEGLTINGDDGDGTLQPSVSPSKPPKSEYHQFFLPFSLPSNAAMARPPAYAKSDEELQEIQKRLDSLPLEEGSELTVAMALEDLKKRVAASWSETKQYVDIPVKDIISRLHGSSGNPIDLTEEESAFINETPTQMLKQIPMKYIHFHEDVRPPYSGTYTKPISETETRRIARNPLLRARPDADYDYDSEAEWEEPEEGEDIDSDGEEDGDSLEGDDDMEGFLDDADDALRAKRALITTDLEPDCSGLCWADDTGVMKSADGFDAPNTFHDYRLGFLLDPALTTIDPFSTAYWQESPNPAAAQSDMTGLMQPPLRVPLQAKPNGGNSKVMEEFTGSFKTAKPSAAAPKPAKRMIPAEHLEEFKKEVEGSDLTKIALVEALKKKFPNLPKDAINNTLSTIAARVGPKEKEKKWVMLNNAS
ncbi:hypothetical protein NA57DRAFT_59009 [Rhizodiscina lignyota]|uniref:Chromatin assembly factor 1 subunit A n=1 Tax=Rhizodiscina lignyota TaxID=1504668 RepID=A0A9P4IBN7_9PEZI|nr:hypothetical protein NA57DRAFT_59009 [Rhizodiscina lignyota]